MNKKKILSHYDSRQRIYYHLCLRYVQIDLRKLLLLEAGDRENQFYCNDLHKQITNKKE